ncbi:MAG: acetyl-CoA carboxylase biotin carboxyl carrier protein subunit [Bacteroidales bacterium]
MTKKIQHKQDMKMKEKPEAELHEFVVEFRKYKTELNKKFLDRKPWVPKDESKVLSFIPGTITKIFVKVGQHVEEGEQLMILEAMKMKNIVSSGRPGVIKKIHVSEGDRVPRSMVVFELELD